MAKNKKSEDATVKVKSAAKETTEAEVVSMLMDVFDEAFNQGEFDDSKLDRVKAGDMFGCEPNEMEVTLKDGSIFSVEITKVRGPK